MGYNIRSLYTPVQPAVNIDASELSNHYERLNIVHPHVYNVIQ